MAQLRGRHRFYKLPVMTMMSRDGHTAGAMIVADYRLIDPWPDHSISLGSIVVHLIGSFGSRDSAGDHIRTHYIPGERPAGEQS